MWGYFFDEDGNIIDTPLYDRLIIPDRSIFETAEKRICVANDRFKSHALLGALRGKLCNVLITNSRIASRLIDLNNKDIID
jgi:DNA-binding transcriptional regulator LsrR (DeoR family)